MRVRTVLSLASAKRAIASVRALFTEIRAERRRGAAGIGSQGRKGHHASNSSNETQVKEWVEHPLVPADMRGQRRDAYRVGGHDHCTPDLLRGQGWC